MYVTRNDVDYFSAPNGRIATIPKGTPCIPADNLPQGGYWAEAWEGMSENQKSWARCYGFLIDPVDVEEVP